LRQVVLANDLQNKEKGILASLLERGQPDELYIAKAVKHLGQRLNIGVVKKTNMIEVSYKSSDPKIAFGVLDKLASLYMEKHLTVHRPAGSYEFFAKETDKYKQALAESEARLADFGKEEGVVAPDVERSDLALVTMNSVAAFHQAEQAIAADQQRISHQEAKMKEIPARSSTQEVSNSANLLLQQLEQSLLAARLKRSQLVLKYDPSYPLVQEADQEIAQTETAIAAAQKTQFVNQTTDRDPTFELLREDTAKTQADLASQKATATALQHSISSMQEQMVSLDQKAVKQADLLREVKADESNYLLYLSKREQERTSDALDEKRIGNVSIAVPPVMPLLPAYSPIVVLLVGCFLAGFLSMCSVFVMEYLDSSFRTPAEVVDVLRIPVLASVPLQST
jgi:polysaccharide biosynthesis protein PslE